MKNFGNHLRTLRKQAGYSQDQLGELAEINPKYLGEIERGIGNPSLEVLMRLAAALQLDLTAVVGDQVQRMGDDELRAEAKGAVERLEGDKLRDVVRILRLATRH